MERIERPLWEPHHCCFTLKDQDPEGFYPGMFIKGREPRAVIAVSYVRQLATDLGYVHPKEHAQLRDEREQLAAQLEQARADLEESERKFEAIDLLQSAGYTARKKPGRPARQPEEAAA